MMRLPLNEQDIEPANGLFQLSADVCLHTDKAKPVDDSSTNVIRTIPNECQQIVGFGLVSVTTKAQRANESLNSHLSPQDALGIHLNMS